MTDIAECKWGSEGSHPPCNWGNGEAMAQAAVARESVRRALWVLLTLWQCHSVAQVLRPSAGGTESAPPPTRWCIAHHHHSWDHIDQLHFHQNSYSQELTNSLSPASICRSPHWYPACIHSKGIHSASCTRSSKVRKSSSVAFSFTVCTSKFRSLYP